MPRQLHLAVAVYGVGGPGQHGLWKDPRVPKNASIDIGYYIKTAQLAEQALFDALFIVDSQFINPSYPSHYLNRLEPLTLLSAVATHTTRIGLVGTASSTYNSPFNLARRFASLDLSSGGRAGWNVVTSFDTGTSKNYGLDEHLDYATRYGRALEAVLLIRGLWDSYELSREIYEADNDFGRKLGFLGRAFGAYDFSQHDLDAPFPDVAHLAEKGGRTRGLELVQRAREQGLTLRQVVEEVTEYHPSPFTGAPDTVADAIAERFEAGAADGLNLRFRTLEDLERFAGDVVPLLTKRGVFRSAYEGDTLRSHLGLPVPVNRYTRARQAAAAERGEGPA